LDVLLAGYRLVLTFAKTVAGYKPVLKLVKPDEQDAAAL
jgi:hypothetical protein